MPSVAVSPFDAASVEDAQEIVCWSGPQAVSKRAAAIAQYLHGRIAPSLRQKILFGLRNSMVLSKFTLSKSSNRETDLKNSLFQRT
jgi:hypothetical protein